MEYTFIFDKACADYQFSRIYQSFYLAEQAFEAGDLPRNIRNACAYSEAVRALCIMGADVDATGIYNDNGFDRIGYGRINQHVFIKNGEFNFEELKAALYELTEE